MGDLSEFSFSIRNFVRLYPWRRIDPVPWTQPARPLKDCRLALVTTAAFTLPEQAPFDENVRGGDPSFREIPSDADLGQLRETHRSESFDHSGIQRDPNLAFPLDRARELVERGRIGSLNWRHLSFMGSITAPGRLIKQTAPEAAKLLAADQVDIALLTPV
jgi:D-proline reductase (dithiol) PrdB